MLGAPAGELASGAAACVEDVAGLLGSLAAGGALAGVVEGLLARLLVTAQNSDDEGKDSDADGAGSADGADDGALLALESGGDAGGKAALVAAAEGLRPVSQVGRDIERALMETDPTGHAERVRATASRRCVSRPRPAGEGVSQVRLLPDGVPLEGLLSSLSSLVGSVSPWWTPSGTGHLPLPAGIHIDVQVTVPLSSLATTDGRGLPTAGGWSLPEPGPTAPAASCSAAPASQSAVSLFAAAGVAQVRVGARGVAVPAMTAWALAAGGTRRSLVNDPMGSTVVDVGRTRYRPPAGLADLVRARDRACVFPTCQTPAERCDIDHLTAWSQGGTTGLDNLVTLCQARHRLKHTPGRALTRDQDSGILSWYTPDKTVYQRHPNGTITRLPRKIGPHQHHAPGDVVPGDLSKQISPDILNRLNTVLNNNISTESSPSASTRLATRGPQPGQKPGAYETTPYPKATHTLGLVPLIDAAPPF